MLLQALHFKETRVSTQYLLYKLMDGSLLSNIEGVACGRTQGLEHLNESHGNIQVRRVAKPEKGQQNRCVNYKGNMCFPHLI